MRTRTCRAIPTLAFLALFLPQPAAAQSLVAAVLPSSRSVQVGTPATAFATIINTGAGTATACGLSPVTILPGTSFLFQTTNPATNQLTGTPGALVDIPAGAAQSFFFSFTPTQPLAPTDVVIGFDCANTAPAPSVSGLNTLLLSASASPVPDIVALAATLNNDGILDIPGPGQSGAFAVATVNVGAGGSITASADTGASSLPVTITICQTQPATGDCLQPPSSIVTTSIGAQATPTFGIFVTANAPVAFDPAGNRLFVRFQDAGGVTRGSTSVAVRTPSPKVTILTSAPVLPTAGWLLAVTSANPEVNGASLDIPARAVAQEVTLSLGTLDSLPGGSPPGQAPVGRVFTIVPSGVPSVIFAELPTLTLPIPAGIPRANLFIGFWDEVNRVWVNLGGTITGDFISTKISHVSVFGVFPAGKSTVRILDHATTDLPNTLTYISGPVPPPDGAAGSPYPTFPPAFPNGAQYTVRPGSSVVLNLAPGRYHFAFSYPHPQPGVANSLFFTIPPLAAGADDSQVDQTITITDTGATSTDPITNASIIFPGSAIVPGSNVRPVIACTAVAPPGVPVTSGDPTSGLPSRIVNIGPINLEAFRQDNPVTLLATPTDPEGHNVRILWSVRDASGLGVVDDQLVASGDTVSRVCGKDNPGCNPSRGGIYIVYATVYDNFNLFDECRWNITVFPNTPPTILAIVDNRVIDFGRLDGGGVTPDRRVLGVGAIPPGTGNLCAYVPLTTVLNTLPTLEGSPVTGPPFFPGSTPHIAPTQYPDGMTCVFAVVADANADALCGGFTLPLPLYGRGNVYAAVPVAAAPIPILDSDCRPTGRTVASVLPGGLAIGAMIDTQAKMDAYNATLFALANAGALPSPFAANGALLPATPPFGPGQALPIVFEAPDDPDVPLTTHDCRHSADCVTLLPPRGGTINVEARVTDGFSAERRDFGLVIFPDVVTVFPSGLSLTVTPNPPDPGPGEGVTVTGCVVPEQAGISINFSIVGTDGYSRASTLVSGADGCADFFIPGGAEGVVDVVTVTVPVQPGVLSAITTIVSYTF